MKEFTSLHCHYNTGSVGDSVLKIKQAVAKAKQLGMKYIAMTDHGSLSAMVEFHEECKSQGITGIIGMEAYVTEDRTCREKKPENKNHHLILLAKNAEGVKNLIRIHNDAQINGFYNNPRTDLSVLKKYGKGLIATSACVGGEIPQLLAQKQVDKAIEKINQYKEVFDEFYLEVQPGSFPLQIITNRKLAALSKATNTPLVVTNDVHYLNKGDYKMHNAHIRMCRGGEYSDDLIYSDTCYYLMGAEEMIPLFHTDNKYLTQDVLNEAIDNTMRIAKQCNGEIEYNFKMPEYPDLPEGETEASWLSKICLQELHKREQSICDPAKYQERLRYELDTIIKLGFPGYFLIVTDFLKHARENGIAVGPGRGSVGGSLVAWLLDITVADPVKYDLLFERFLSPNRKGLPDWNIYSF